VATTHLSEKCAIRGRDQVSQVVVAAKLSSLLTTLGVCVLKIQRSTNGRVVFTLSGRIEAEDVKELGQLFALETAGQQLVLDLTDVALVNQDAVEFLAGCEADSIKLENCPAYIRVWIEAVKGRNRRQRTR
jgi:anti-anti-sigma regulatory factor